MSENKPAKKQTSKKMFGKFPRCLITTSPTWAGVPWRGKGVLAVIVALSDGISKSCSPTRETIQRLAGFKKLRDVDLGVSELIERGIIDKVSRVGEATGKNRANIYILLIDTKHDFSQLPSWVILDEVWAAMTPEDKSIYVAIVGSSKKKFCEMTIPEIKIASGVNKPHTISKSLKNLESLGVLSVRRCSSGFEFTVI